MADSGRKKDLNALLVALAAGKSVRDAARAAGVSERTATRRMADPDFRRRVSALRAEMMARAAGTMADAMTEAAATLRKLLKAKGESVRLGASRSLLELGVRLRDSVEFEARLAALEGKVDEPKSKGTS